MRWLLLPLLLSGCTPTTNVTVVVDCGQRTENGVQREVDPVEQPLRAHDALDELLGLWPREVPLGAVGEGELDPRAVGDVLLPPHVNLL